MRRPQITIIILSMSFFLYGCETLKGIGRGAKEGAKKDYEAAQKADGWFRKNAW